IEEDMTRLFTLLTLVLLPIWADEAAAQASGVGIDVENISARRIAGDNVYSVKFVCGQQNVPNIGSAPSSFVAGRYRTAINLPQYRTLLCAIYRERDAHPVRPPMGSPADMMAQ